MHKALGRPPPHLEGTLQVQSCINGKLSRGVWKERYVLVLKNKLIIYEKGSRHHSTRKVWKTFDLIETKISDAVAQSVPTGFSVNWTFNLQCLDENLIFLAPDHDQYKFWFESLLYVKDFWIDRMITNKAPNDVAPPDRGEFEAEVTDISGCHRMIRLNKDAKFRDFYGVWTARDDGKASNTRTPTVTGSFRMLQEKGAQLWGIHKTEGECLVNKFEEIYPYVVKGYQLFLLEKCYKLIVISFDDDEVVAVPVPPNITTAEVAKLPSIKEKLNEKDSSASFVLVKRSIDTGIDIPLKDGDKPLDIFYESENGVAHRKPDVKVKLIYMKEEETDLLQDKTPNSLPSGVIPKNVPDLFPVYRLPSQRGKSPIKGMFQGLGKSNGNEVTKASSKNLDYEVSNCETDPCERLKADTEDTRTNIKTATPPCISSPPLPPKKRIENLLRSSANTETSVKPRTGSAVGVDTSVKTADKCDVESTITESERMSDSSSNRAYDQSTMNNVVTCTNEKSQIIGERCHNDSTMPIGEGRLCSSVDGGGETSADHSMKSPAVVLSPGNKEAGNGEAVISGKHSEHISSEDDVPSDDIGKCEYVTDDQVDSTLLPKISIGQAGIDSGDSGDQCGREVHGDSDITKDRCDLLSGQVIGDSLIDSIVSEKEKENNSRLQEPNTHHKFDVNEVTITQEFSNLTETSEAPSLLRQADPRSGELDSLNSNQEFHKDVRVVDVQVHCPGHLPGDIQVPVVGKSVGAFLPSGKQRLPANPLSCNNQNTPILVNIQNSPKVLPTSVNSSQIPTVVNGGVGMILPSRMTSSLGSSPCDHETEDCSDDVDGSDEDDESCVSSIETFMESFDSAKHEMDTIENALRQDAGACNSEESDLRLREGSRLDRQSECGSNVNVPEQGNSVSSSTAETFVKSHLVKKDSMNESREESVYEAGELRRDSMHRRRDAFKRNEFEKDVTMERIRRHRVEREEEEKRIKEEETRREEMRQKEAAQEKARLKEAEKEELMQGEARQMDSTATKMASERVIEPAVAQNKAGSNRRPASPMKRRVACATCDLCDAKPFQVVKLKEMKVALRDCTQTGDANGSSIYNYLCLSGVHIRNINGTWELVDDTVFHSESELTSSLDSLKAQALKTDGDSIASKVKRDRKFWLTGGVCCHWIPTNGGKWRVTGFTEDHVKPSLNPEDERLRPIPSPCFGSSRNEVRAREDSTTGVAKEQRAISKMHTMRNTISEKVESTARVVGSTVKEVFVQQRPSHEMYISLETLEFRERYIVPLGKVVIAIGQHFLDAESCRIPRQAGDDSVCPALGWLIRRDFCTAFFSLILHDMKRDKSVTRFLTGRTSKYSLWSLIADVTQACVEVPVLQEVISIIQKCPFLFDDDLRARNFVCEALNWHNETWNETLLITWFRNFTRMKHLIDKYFEKSSIWKRPDREVAGIVSELLHILEHLNPYHFNLHADFEHKELAKRASEQSLAFILQREPRHVDMDAMTFE